MLSGWIAESNYLDHSYLLACNVFVDSHTSLRVSCQIDSILIEVSDKEAYLEESEKLSKWY